MAIDYKSTGDLLAVSTLAQTALDTPATIDRLIRWAEDSAINVKTEREGNQGEKTGHVEATDVDVKDRSAEGVLKQDKATPDGIAWMAAFALGNHSMTTPVSGVRRHTSKLIAYPPEPYYFSGAHRKGGASGAAAAELLRHKNLGLTSLQMSLAKEEFLKTEAGVLGTGDYDSAIYTEKITALNNASSLTLGKDPLGDAYQNVTVWADQDGDGQFETQVIATAYNPGTNALTITALPGDGLSSISYRLSYHVKASESGYSWSDLSALAVAQEFLLKASNLQVFLSGRYTEPGGTPTFTGGQQALCELESLTWKLDWQAKIGRCWRSGSAEDPTATSIDLGDAVQTIEIDRRMRDYLLSQSFDENTAFAIYFDAIGPVISGSEKFFVKVYWPRVKLLSKDTKISDKRWVEAGSMLVLKDASGGFPTVVIQTQNAQTSGYLA